MLDVHPPHEAVHTWKDFFIHIATICVGLLIAVGLEQSVEAIHHNHQRHQLEADIHAECVRNDAILNRDLRLVAIKRAAVVALRDRADSLRRGVTKTALPELPALNNEDLFMPAQGAWTSARDSSQLALLPRELTEMYEEIYSQRVYVKEMADGWFNAGGEWENFENQFSGRTTTRNLDLTHLTTDQLGQYSSLLTRWITQADRLTATLEFFAKENKIAMDGATTDDELQRRMAAEH